MSRDKRLSNILSVILVATGFVALSIFLLFSTERILSMSEEELFENLVATFKIFESFHTSVAIFIALFSLTVLWITWIVYLTYCIIILVRYFKEKHNDS